MRRYKHIFETMFSGAFYMRRYRQIFETKFLEFVYMRRYRQIFETMFLRFCICVVADIFCNHASIQGDLHLHRSRPFWEIMRLRFFLSASIQAGFWNDLYLRRTSQVFYLRRSRHMFGTISYASMLTFVETLFTCVDPDRFSICVDPGRCLKLFWSASIEADVLSASIQAYFWNYFYLRRSRQIFEVLRLQRLNVWSCR